MVCDMSFEMYLHEENNMIIVFEKYKIGPLGDQKLISA